MKLPLFCALVLAAGFASAVDDKKSAGGSQPRSVPDNTQVMQFKEGMTRPELLSGEDPVYTKEALEERVQGLAIIKCVITAEGTVTSCRIIKPLVHMEQSLLKALESRRYKPVLYKGKPIAVDYVFNIKLTLPEPKPAEAANKP
jgi:TonB family protein